MTTPGFALPSLPPNTIIPQDKDLFIEYMNRLYEDIAFTVNNKDTIYFPIPVTSSPVNIPNMASFGSFLICVSGTDPGAPTLIAALVKASNDLVGTIIVVAAQAGNIAPWLGAILTITSTTTNFQIQHSVAGQIGNFNIRFIGTQ